MKVGDVRQTFLISGGDRSARARLWSENVGCVSSTRRAGGGVWFTVRLHTQWGLKGCKTFSGRRITSKDGTPTPHRRGSQGTFL